MFKSLILATALVVSTAAQASNFATDLFRSQIAHIQASAAERGLNWAVGDENNYKLNMGGFLNGTMKMYVREINGTDAWLVQDVDMMIQKQKIEVLIDMNTGAVKKMLVNGKEQQVPESEYEIVDQKEDTITVAAGTFEVIYLKVLEKKQNQTSEEWVNPRDIPINGMAKSVAQSQMGAVNIELTSFIKK